MDLFRVGWGWVGATLGTLSLVSLSLRKGHPTGSSGLEV